MNRHLFISLNGDSWGSTAMARTIADDLAAAGDEVVFFARDRVLQVLSNAAFRCEILPAHMEPLAELCLQNLIAEMKPTTVVVADYFGSANFLFKMGIATDCMLPANARIFALDPWDSERTGYEVDTTCGCSFQVGPSSKLDGAHWHKQFESIPYKLKPVPMTSLPGIQGSFSSLPAPMAFSRQVRPAVRQRLGLREQDKALLFCTNLWQHPSAGGRFEKQAEALPALLAEYVTHLGDSAQLVHIGPKPYQLDRQLDHRYRWLPSLAPSEFDAVMAGMDLMLSANISATTVVKAMSCGLPVVMLQNSFSVATLDEAEAAARNRLSPWMSAWLERALPLLPFSLWPLGFHRFLAPLLQSNPYAAALEIVEILDEQRMDATLAALVFDESRRDERLHRQSAYLAQVRSLPTGAQAIQTIC